MTTEPLTRQYLLVRSDVIGPGAVKDLGYAGSSFSERMKHLIEPTFALEYIPPIDNASRVLKLADSSDIILGDTARVTYGINNRFLYRARTAEGSAGSTDPVPDGRRAADVLPDEAVEPERHAVCEHVFTVRDRSISPTSPSNVKLTPSPALESTTRLEYDVHGAGLHVDHDRRNGAVRR